MEINKKGVVLRRLRELLLSCFLLSVVATVLNIMNVIETSYGLMILLSIFSLFFWVVNVRQMRDCYYDLKGDKSHYKLNLIAYMIFIAVNALLFLFVYFTKGEISKYIYTGIFALTKLFKYIPPYINSNFMSAAVFHAVGIVLVFIAPTGIRIEEDYNEKKKSEE